jgi:hypothetical protein
MLPNVDRLVNREIDVQLNGFENGWLIGTPAEKSEFEATSNVS